jgi:hypothetical protein
MLTVCPAMVWALKALGCAMSKCHSCSMVSADLWQSPRGSDQLCSIPSSVQVIMGVAWILVTQSKQSNNKAVLQDLCCCPQFTFHSLHCAPGTFPQHEEAMSRSVWCPVHMRQPPTLVQQVTPDRQVDTPRSVVHTLHPALKNPLTLWKACSLLWLSLHMTNGALHILPVT